jgi:hypothetical protein
MQYALKTPDGQTTTLLDVPQYDFNWQLQYRFADPVKVPRGSSIIYTAWYDNSDKNPANPDPKRTVRWGPQTYDEMHLGYVEFVVDSGSYDPNGLLGGLNVDVANFRFPKEGVVIPEPGRNLFRRFDTNNDGRLDEKEFEALPETLKRIVILYIQRTMP